MATRMQQRRGTSAQWTSANPVLAAGEIGFETDTNQFKMGDGVNTWTNLAYFVDEDSVSGSLGDYVELALLGVSDGVATLDSTGNVPASQLANIIDAAPAALDTLNELAAALNDDASFATTITNSIATKKKEIVQEVSSNITMEAGYRYLVDTTSARTLTLPATPAVGDEIQIFDASENAATNNITVNNNSEKINGELDTALLDVDALAAVFVYTGSTYGWRMS